MADVTPVMQQYLDMKKEHEDAVLFFRMGDFYEMFFEDAKTASRVLGLTLTSRDKKSDNPIPMAGIPYHALNGYLTKMLQAGHKVAICEQTTLPGKSRGPVEREVVQVVTPGTVMTEEALKSDGNNYIATLSFGREAAGIAIADLTTGEFTAGEVSGDGRWLDELERYGPSEVLLSDTVNPDIRDSISKRLNGTMITDMDGWQFERSYAEDRLKEHFHVRSLKGFGIDDSAQAVSAAGAMLSYLAETQKASLSHINAIKRYRTDTTMFLDARTRRNLELTAPLAHEGSSRFTLFNVLDDTVTPMGGRLLKSWLTGPLLDPEEITSRHEGVRVLYDDQYLLAELREVMSSIADIERLISKVCLDRANPRDMLALAESMEKSYDLRMCLERCSSGIITSQREEMGDLREIAGTITDALSDDPPVSVSDGGIFRDGYNDELDELRQITRSGRRWIADLQEQERIKTGIQNLKIKYNNVFGYFIEVSKSQLDRVPEDYHRKQTLVNAERFITPELKEYETKVLSAGDRSSELERELFSQLRAGVAEKVLEIQQFSRAVAVVDVLHAFARVAREHRYVQPVIDNGTLIEIREGRHPVVETLIPAGTFVSNDTVIDAENEQVLIITGPNMAGKSTYLRQVGLIVLLAQAGSFVPATEARIGVVDRIFTRVGASDNLAGGESTFLVEMNETADILNNCTTRSLILFDEVGRGTSTFDGLSIAWSIVEYLHQTKKSAARTLFATHYHELTELEMILDRVKNYNIAVKEWNDEIVFLRSIVEGGSDQSLGIQVARLAGLPPRVIERAKEILLNLEANELSVDANPRLTKPKETPPQGFQMSLFEMPEHPVVKELKELDVDNITPIKALLMLEQLKRKVMK